MTGEDAGQGHETRDKEGLLSGSEQDDQESDSEEDGGKEGLAVAGAEGGDDQDSGKEDGEEMDPASELEALRRQVEALKLEKKLAWSCNLKAESVRGDDAMCKELTGLSWTTFQCLCNYMMPFDVSSKTTLSKDDQLFIVLLKLRQNPSTSLLSHTLKIGQSTIRDMFSKWINLLYSKIKFMIHWPDRECIHTTTPPAIQALFPKLTCIVDCFEIRIESPKNLKAR